MECNFQVSKKCLPSLEKTTFIYNLYSTKQSAQNLRRFSDAVSLYIELGFTSRRSGSTHSGRQILTNQRTVLYTPSPLHHLQLKTQIIEFKSIEDAFTIYVGIKLRVHICIEQSYQGNKARKVISEVYTLFLLQCIVSGL